MVRQTLSRAALALALALGAGITSANAAPITFSFGGSSSLGSIGNQRTWTVDGVTVYGTAWYYDDDNDNRFEKAALGRYSPGLGVCNSYEESGSDSPFNDCDSPNHAVSNNDDDWYDYVLFLFDQSVDLTSVYVDEIEGRTDVSYWLGTVAGAATQLELLTNKTTGQLGGLGFGSRIDNDGNGDRSVTLNSPAGGYNALVFGARFGGDDDAFKIKSLTIDYAPGGPRTPETPVPEPASLVLMGCGLVGVASAVRRRRAARE
jgi:hypothetical protein